MLKPSERVIRSVILDFFDELYRDVERNPLASHCEIRSIYAYLAHSVPSASVKSCYQAIHDLCQDCLSTQSVYPFPDGAPWTDEERARYHDYLMRATSKEDDAE